MELERLGYPNPWTEAVFQDCFRSDYRGWALQLDGVLQAYAVVAYLFDEAHLLNICVAPSARRAGAGRRLLRHCIAASLHDGMQAMLLEVRRSNQVAAALYETEGFKVIGVRKGYYPDGLGREDALVMSLSLIGEHR
ncbi:MAG: ribosomal protein S18-alanine N-acetyltransferase [Marinobacter sp.]|nr:ribosomal protein S18-alanine N-acetyltransferase [Marinobacter sp.]